MSHLTAVRRPSTPFTATLLLAAALGATGFSSARAQTCEPAPSDTAPVFDLETVRLVTFQIGTLSQVQVIGILEDAEVTVAEAVPAGGSEQFLIEPGMNPVEVFALLAPADTPVPRMIADLDKLGLLAGRRVVESLSATILVDPAQLGLRTKRTPLFLKASGGSCQDGQAGADYFEAHHCNTLGGPGYGSSESYCDSDWADSIQRTSSSKRRAAYTRMASCGSANNRLKHYYDTISGWNTQVNLEFAPNQVVDIWSAKTGIKRYRRVRFEETSAGGWVRGWTKYHSEVAGGWF